MNVPFFIARRYLFSKKTTNVINLISYVAIAGVMVGTMALVSVLSIFNGLESLIVERFNTFNNDFRIEKVKGKYFSHDTAFFNGLAGVQGVEAVLPVLEENVLIKYNEIYHPFTMKGVDTRFTEVVDLSRHMIDGQYLLNYSGAPTLLMGIAASGTLSYNTPFIAPVQVYVPNPASGPGDSPEHAFFTESVMVSGIFSIDPELDYTIIAPITFMQHILGDSTRINAVEIVLKNGSDEETCEKELQHLLGDDFDVKNRHEQNALLFKIMKSEKLIVFLLLAFILLIASFNILGSLTMLIIEKKQDAAVIRGFGLGLSGVRKIFLYQGLMISFIGAAAGILLGVLFCILQQKYAIIPMEGVNPGSFIVSAYPVEMRVSDFLIVFATVMLIGYFAARFPVRFITRRFMTDK